MGKTIEKIAQERGHEIIACIDSKSSENDLLKLKETDVVIEFTRPEAALENFLFAMKNQIKLVTGTTGWYDRMQEVKHMVKQHDGSFFWASNFSIGVNLFWEINKKLASLMADYPQYKASIEEIHHTQKLDEPSGTAITTAEQIIARNSQINNWKLSYNDPLSTDLIIKSIREGDVKGTHMVKYESTVDQIELKHEAKTREGFALGAVIAAEFLAQKNGFYTMNNLLGFN